MVEIYLTADLLSAVEQTATSKYKIEKLLKYYVNLQIYILR